MKIVYRISIILNILFAGYILIRGGELLMKDYLVNKENSTEQIVTTEEMSETAVTGECVTCDTVYTISEYDLTTGRQDVYQQQLPASFIGMNRAQLVEWMDNYNLSASLEDLEDGFRSMELISFSQEEIRVRRRVESKEENADNETDIKQPEQLFFSEEETTTVSGNGTCYGCILAQDGLLTVYDGDRRHVILYTDISVFDLSESVQQEIMEGKYVYSEQELYHLLESYSS